MNFWFSLSNEMRGSASKSAGSWGKEGCVWGAGDIEAWICGIAATWAGEIGETERGGGGERCLLVTGCFEGTPSLNVIGWEGVIQSRQSFKREFQSMRAGTGYSLASEQRPPIASLTVTLARIRSTLYLALFPVSMGNISHHTRTGMNC